MTSSSSRLGVLRAFGWLRWRLLFNRWRSARRRDLLSRLSRWGDIIGLAVMTLALLPLLPSVTFGAILVGWAMATERMADMSQPQLGQTFRAVLLLFVFLALFIPFTLGAQRALPASERLLLLPIARRRLHLIRFLSSLIDPVLLFGGVALTLFPVGLAVGGRPGVAAIALAAGVLLLLTLAALTATVEAILPRLLRRRRSRDLLVLLLTSIGIAASFSLLLMADQSTETLFTEGIFLLNVPGELYAQALFESLGGHSWTAMLALAALAGSALLSYGIWTRAHERVLSPEGGHRKSGAQQRSRATSRFHPSTPTGAIAATELRYLSRTVTGKMALVQGTFGAVMVAIIAARTDALPTNEQLGPELIFLAAALVLTCLGLLPLLFNQFAIDRAGLTLSFLLPLSPAQLVRGRVIVHVMLGAASMFLAWTVTVAVVRPPGPRLLWSAVYTAMATASAMALLGALGAAMSTVFPRAVNLGRAFQQNQPHTIATLVGMAASVFACGVPALLALAGLLLLESPLAAGTLLAVWLLLSLGVAILLVNLAAPLLSHRRESLLLVAGETKSQ